MLLTPRRARRPMPRAALLVAALLALTVPAAGGSMPPLEWSQTMGDPSVAKTRKKQYVAVATGPQVVRMVSHNGRTWRAAEPALLLRPAWARRKGDIWAADIVRLRKRWVLYYAAPVRGLTATSRCIGVAVARSSTGAFRPVGDRPLVCPPSADTPPAWDRLLDRGATKPRLRAIGAIDPSLFVDRGRVYLIYKTDGRPSSIRALRLKAGGLQPKGARSRQLFASSGVLENPVLVRRGGWYYVFLSAGDYTRCSYATAWRRSKRLLNWRHRAQRVLLDRTTTRGLCGPGGADVVADGNRLRLYFHGWTCRGTPRPCAEPFHHWQGREAARRPVRALYGAWLSFTKHHTPKVRRLARSRR